MAEFVCNNDKNAFIKYFPFEFNYSYHLYVLYKENINSHSKFKSGNKLLLRVWELITVCYKNFYYN